MKIYMQQRVHTQFEWIKINFCITRCNFLSFLTTTPGWQEKCIIQPFKFIFMTPVFKSEYIFEILIISFINDFKWTQDLDLKF